MNEFTARLDAIRSQLTAPGAPFEMTAVKEANGAEIRVYRHAFATLVELIQAGRAHGDKPFIFHDDGVLTFDDLYRQADRLAGALVSRFGVLPGDRVALAMRNRVEWVVGFVAAVLCGAVAAPVNSLGQTPEMVAALEDLDPRVLLADAERLQRLLGAAGGASTGSAAGGASPATRWAVIQCDDAARVVAGSPSLGEVLATAMPLSSPAAPAPQDPAVILFTSGATSRAKAAVSSHRAVCQAMHNIDFIGAQSAMSSPQALQRLMAKGLAPTTLTAVPLFHVSGLHAQLLLALRHGRRLVFMRRFEPGAAIELMRRHSVTQFNAAPSMVLQVMEHPQFQALLDQGTLGGIGFGGAGLPQRAIDTLNRALPDSLSGVGYGMTETNGAGAAISGDAFRAQPTSSGRLSPVMDVRVVDEGGRDCAEGARGQILLRGPCLMSEYRSDAAATAAALADGWLHTGDVGYVQDGWLFVVDRMKAVINRNGEKIAAAEVESCLLQHPAIAEAVVVGAPDAKTGEAVAAFLVARPGQGLDADQVQDFMRPLIAAHKIPTRICVLDQPLPRSATGKVLRQEVLRLLDHP